MLLFLSCTLRSQLIRQVSKVSVFFLSFVKKSIGACSQFKVCLFRASIHTNCLFMLCQIQFFFQLYFNEYYLNKAATYI